MKISACVLTKNSSKTIEVCLESLLWCDEIVIVDDISTDNTLSIAKKYTTKIYRHALEEDFSSQRNFAIDNTANDWIFFVDSDEIISDFLKKEIQAKITNKNLGTQGYYIRRIDTMWGKRILHGETGNTWLLRLAKKNAGKWYGKVHETWHVLGKTKKLKNTLNHFPHPAVQDFLGKINFYSTLRAQELYKKNVRVRLLDIIFYPKGKFLVNYIFKFGFLDGIPGLLIAVLMSFHSFLVRGKLWQLQQAHQ